MICRYCQQPMTYGSTPSHYERGQCADVGAAFDPVVKDKRGNKPGYNSRTRTDVPEDESTWNKVCSVPGCGAPVKRTGYCKLHQAEYMVGWRTGESRPRGPRRIHDKRVRPDADPEIE